jgi:tetratricopeptide (TPR) repeat protein
MTDTRDEIVHAGQVGELFWGPGVEPAVQGQEFRFFPGAPLHGKAPENPTLTGIIDSGVATAHPQLAGYVRACADFGGEGPEDTLGHGTAVALQLLFAHGVINPSIAILSAKVTDSEGHIRQQAVVDAIDWVAQRGATIVNLSLGFRGSAEMYKALCAAIARHPDILFVAAAGNYGSEVEVFPAACGHDNVISVSAADETGKPAEYGGRGEVYASGNALFLKEWAYHYEQGQTLARSGRLQEARREYERSLASGANAESEFQLGVLDLSEEKPAAAIGRFIEAIKLNPSFAEAHEMLGAAHMLSGEYPRAEAALRTAIALYPADAASAPSLARTHFNLGQTLVNLGRRKEAREQFETVRAMMPDYPRIDDALASVSD